MGRAPARARRRGSQPARGLIKFGDRRQGDQEMRSAFIACVLLLAGCGPDSRGRVTMQASSGSLRLDPSLEQPGRWRATLTNAWDFGYDGADRGQRLRLIQTALRCPVPVTVLQEREFVGGTGVLVTREPRTYVMDVECPQAP